MNTQQLKQLAVRLRALLEDAAVEIGHGQALDLSASLVGLRNWPEVQAFPQRVQAQELDLSATARLAYRLANKYNHEASSTELLQLLLPPADLRNASTPYIWPAGPEAGVYITTTQTAIDALVERYQEATDGAVFYAERAGMEHDAAINLGDDGLWSGGLERVPSGTLVVLGPIELDQQSWREASDRVEMACIRAESSGHRVAILFDTLLPAMVGADATVMLLNKGDDDLHENLVGTVGDDGNLQPGLVRQYSQPIKGATVTDTSALPKPVADQLKAVFTKKNRGIIALGSIEDVENHGTKIGEAVLALTEHLGLAARILPRHRSTMSKFDQVPAAVSQLPFLASIESAYAQGYRRFLIDPRYTKPEVLARFVDDSLFIACTYAATVEELAMCTVAANGRSPSLLPWLLAAVVVAPMQTSEGTEILTDVYIGVEDVHIDNAGHVFDFVARHRTIRIEDQFKALVDSGEIDIAVASDAGIGQRTIKRLARLFDAER
ncbi:glyoxalase superfamily protein [Janthinobacterium agaricidamnosum]|uniref:Glyoxalase-related protein domain-containing protein n=1 Tax=Janthinobacterium agaricidamnosum NBRC 102515 = DSM 9628 TaxID=1349767 RepID=W0V770_9BURK|nr:glyoxalase superfamily protein [Janthinobacterium agaricidamnosum]CDG83112.1 putative uncharacterized protein [Janthinobacterium agaricidamnosum NBRC 102515 = DSM 9628]